MAFADFAGGIGIGGGVVVPKPKKPAATSPLAAIDQINQWLATSGPDYSQVAIPDYGALSDEARAQVEEWKKDITGQRDQDMALLGAQRKLSSDAATNFNTALANILTGGLEGQAGRDYALKTFGGSYLGEIQTLEGQRMLSGITRDFDDQTFALLDKYDKILDQAPEMYDDLYADLTRSAEANYQQGRDLADADFQTRFKAALALSKSLQWRAELEQKGELGRLKEATKVIVAKMKQAGMDPQVVRRSDGSQVLIDKTTGQVVQEIGGPTPPKPAKPTKPRTGTTTVNGQKVLINLDTGETIRVLGPSGSGSSGSGGSGGKPPSFDSVRRAALSAARDLFGREQRPTQAQAFNALMDGYGRRLIGAGYKRKTVETMIRRILASVAAGQPWGTAAAGSAGSAGGGFTEP